MQLQREGWGWRGAGGGCSKESEGESWGDKGGGWAYAHHSEQGSIYLAQLRIADRRGFAVVQKNGELLHRGQRERVHPGVEGGGGAAVGGALSPPHGGDIFDYLQGAGSALGLLGNHRGDQPVQVTHVVLLQRAHSKVSLVAHVAPLLLAALRGGDAGCHLVHRQAEGEDVGLLREDLVVEHICGHEACVAVLERRDGHLRQLRARRLSAEERREGVRGQLGRAHLKQRAASAQRHRRLRQRVRDRLRVLRRDAEVAELEDRHGRVRAARRTLEDVVRLHVQVHHPQHTVEVVEGCGDVAQQACEQRVGPACPLRGRKDGSYAALFAELHLQVHVALVHPRVVVLNNEGTLDRLCQDTRLAQLVVLLLLRRHGLLRDLHRVLRVVVVVRRQHDAPKAPVPDVAHLEEGALEVRQRHRHRLRQRLRARQGAEVALLTHERQRALLRQRREHRRALVHKQAAPRQHRRAGALPRTRFVHGAAGTTLRGAGDARCALDGEPVGGPLRRRCREEGRRGVHPAVQALVDRCGQAGCRHRRVVHAKAVLAGERRAVVEHQSAGASARLSRQTRLGCH
eukprot:Rhum_TRINITY_DN25696_c0_g1::Rhum_TRINITY_DN25696_c0_g1_i1::g.182483::m.182483